MERIGTTGIGVALPLCAVLLLFLFYFRVERRFVLAFGYAMFLVLGVFLSLEQGSPWGLVFMAICGVPTVITHYYFLPHFYSWLDTWLPRRPR